MSHTPLLQAYPNGGGLVPQPLFSNSAIGGLYRFGDAGVTVVDRIVAACMRIWKNPYHQDLDWNCHLIAAAQYQHNVETLIAHPDWLPGYDQQVWSKINTATIGFRPDDAVNMISQEQLRRDSRVPKAVRVALKATAIGLIGLLSTPVALPCALVGVPLRIGLSSCMNELVVVPSPLKAKDYDKEFSILTQNVAMTEFEIMNSVNQMRPSKERADELIAYLIRHLMDNDVFCLEEAFTPSINANIAEQLRKHGYSTVYQGKPKRVGMDSGLLLASRYEIMAADFTRFPHSAGVDSDADKGVMMVKLRLGDKLCAFVTVTHMQASNVHPSGFHQRYPDQYLNKVHEEQFKTISTFMNQFISTHTGTDKVLFTLLCGDLNISRFENLFGNPAIYANNLAYSPLEKLLQSGFHELTDTGEELDDAAEGNHGTGLGVGSQSYRFAKENFLKELGQVVPNGYRSNSAIKKFIKTGFGFVLYDKSDWENAIIMLQGKRVPAGIVGTVITGIKDKLADAADMIYRESGIIDHILLRSDNLAKFYDYFDVKRTSGTMLGKGGPISDHNYVRVQVKESENSPSQTKKRSFWQKVNLLSD